MKKARIALWCIAVCIVAMLFIDNVVLIHPVFASSISKTKSPTRVSNADIASLKPNMACSQPPVTIDHATLSNADLDKYGLPRYQSGMNKVAWQSTVRAMKHHVCSGTLTRYSNSLATGTYSTHQQAPTCSPYNLGSATWTGNITVNASTDGTCTQGNQYTEADAVFSVPCVKPGSPTGVESSWVGLGGVNNSNLVQAGSHSEIWYDIFGGTHYNYYAWTQNVATSSTETWLFGVNCNDRMQVFVYHSNETYLVDHTNGDYNTTTTGPAASYATAEWIVERPSSCNIFGSNCNPQPLADFQSDTFYGMGTTVASLGYLSPHDVDHDYANMTGKTKIGSLVYNTTWGPPNYANTITWVHQ